MVNPRVFLDFAVDGASVGRVIFELYSVSAPKTTENFRALCTGERGVSPKSHIPLYYKHSKMHRVIQDFMVQGGDFTKGNGTGGESIYGGPFTDEDLSRPVDQPGLLCMANKGPNTNNSQFFITLRPCPHLTGKHVVFGRVIRGFDDVVLRQIANVPTDEKDRPTVPVEIINCGELQLVKRPASAAAAAADTRKENKEKGSEESESEEERGRKKRKRRLHSSSRSRSLSRSPSVSRSYSPVRSISRSRPRSLTPDSRSERSDSEADRRRRNSSKKKEHRKDKKEEKKKNKKRKSHRRRSPSSSRSRSASYERALSNGHTSIPRQETEEEYDARLEREERERIEEARRRELAEIKKRYEAEQARKAGTGVRFKGRGRMKYIDPEFHSRRKN
ncbi:hypothetical protein ACEPAF_8596 [Sanghuangporus sanghuang]